MFSYNKPVKAKAIDSLYVPYRPYYDSKINTIGWSNNAYFSFDLDIVRLVAKKVQLNIWRDAKGEDKERLYDIVFAALRCIPSETVLFYATKEPREVDDRILGAYSKLQELTSTKPDSPILNKRIEQLNSYYEKQYEYRNFIQNKYWEFKDLNEDAGLFMKLREKYKMYSKDFSKFGKSYNGKECLNCKYPCVRPCFNICTYCQDFDRLEMFIKVSKCLRVMGSYYQFYWYLSMTTIDYMIKNWNRLSEVFSTPLQASPLDMYLNEMDLRKIQAQEEEEKFKEKLEKQKEEDEMYKLICQLYNDQETRDKRYEELEREKLRTKLAKKKAEEEKKKWIKAMYKNHLDAKKKNQKKLDEAALLKDLTEDPMFHKSLEEMGDKELK